VPPFSYAQGPLGVFVNGLGQFGGRDLTTSENGFSFNNAGFVAGADLRLTPQVIAGLAFGYTQSNTSFDTSALSASGQSLNGNLLQGNLYASYFPTDALYLNGIAIIGGGNNDSQRHIVISSVTSTPAVDRIATGSFGSRIAGFTLSGGYDVPAGAFILTPIARFLYQHTGVSAFSEQGAIGADLQYGSSSVNSVLTFLGGDAQYKINTAFGMLYPIARFRWAHQYSPGNTAVTVAYGNDPTSLSSFILPGIPTSRNYFDLGAGISLQLSGNKSAFIAYDSILGISHTSFNSFSIGARLIF
jgi:outer membrane lipase/esterase